MAKAKAERNAFEAFERLVRPLGSCLIEGREEFVIEPVNPPPDHMEFDRQVCAFGLKSFLRPVMPSDFPKEWPANWPPRSSAEKCNHVLVTEASPGVRTRQWLTLYSRAVDKNVTRGNG
jgi:hypothetical protein